MPTLYFPNSRLYVKWIDSFYARDILELFGIRNQQGLLSLFRLLLHQNGG